MSIKTKIIGCFIAVLFLFITSSSLSFHKAQKTNERLSLINEVFLPLSRQIVQLQSNINGLSDDMKRYYFHNQSQTSAESSNFSRMVRDLYPYVIQKRFLTVERILSKGANSEGVTSELIQMTKAAKETFERAISTSESARFEKELFQLKGELQAISKKVDDACQKITEAAFLDGKTNLVAGSAFGLLLALVGVLTIFVSYRVLNPLPLLISAIKKITDGDFNQTLKLKTSDKGEVATLAREYNRMLDALKERDSKIQEQQTEILRTEKLAAVGQLSAEVVHEIRNPLNSMSLNIDWLESELNSSDPEVKKTLQSISREIQRLAQITESYLVRARIPSQDSQKAPVNEVIKEIIDFEKVDSNTLKIDAELSKEEIYVKADRGKLKQAFLNVIRNAKEATPKGGRLTIRTELSQNISRILFSDTGCGMSPATQQKTFEPFFTTKTSGTGLGLTLTKEIVESAHGTINCESRLGQGTTFIFQFPLGETI